HRLSSDSARLPRREADLPVGGSAAGALIRRIPSDDALLSADPKPFRVQPSAFGGQLSTTDAVAPDRALAKHERWTRALEHEAVEDAAAVNPAARCARSSGIPGDRDVRQDCRAVVRDTNTQDLRRAGRARGGDGVAADDAV